MKYLVLGSLQQLLKRTNRKKIINESSYYFFKPTPIVLPTRQSRDSKEVWQDCRIVNRSLLTFQPIRLNEYVFAEKSTLHRGYCTFFSVFFPSRIALNRYVLLMSLAVPMLKKECRKRMLMFFYLHDFWKRSSEMSR